MYSFILAKFSRSCMPQPVTLLKKRLWHRCFPVNCAKFLRTPFLTEHLWWLLLYFESYCPLHYIAQRYHLLYFRFIAYFLRTLISRCTSYWQFLCKRWLVKSYPILFCLQILNHITY